MSIHEIRLPSRLEAGGQDASRAILDRLRQAMQKDVAPVTVPVEEPLRSYSVRIPAMVEAEVMSRYAVGTNQIALTVAQVIWAQDAAACALEAEDPPAKDKALLFVGRPEQATFHGALARALEEPGALVLAEGGTGLGKGRVIAALAHAYSGCGVVVAAPTIQILGQLLGEYEALPFADKKPAGFLLGVDQFVCERALGAWIDTSNEAEEAAARAAARDWIAAGTPSRSRASGVFHRASPGLGWLVEDLARVAPGLPLAEIRLRHADLEGNDAGGRSYQRVRLRALAGLRVVFATHAALVWDRRMKAKGQVGMLPAHAVALIDEAHQLAGIAESAFSSQIALRTLLHGLDNPDLWRRHGEILKARKIATELRAVIDEIGSVPMLTPMRGETVGIGPDVMDAIEAPLKRLRGALGRLADLRGDGSIVAAAQEAARLVRDLLDGRANATLSLSRVRAFPSIVGGPRSIRLFFEEFWTSIDRAALISATLYLPREMGEGSYGLIQTTCHLPRNRIRALPPIAPAWLYDVDLHTPSVSARQAFMPPQESDFAEVALFDAALRQWILQVASALQQVYDRARGGVLVLLTSYETIDALAEILMAVAGTRLVVQRRGGFRVSLGEFLGHYRSGERALWLATGPAWTGLDLSARSALDNPVLTPDQDLLCTDLVIPRVPFGTEQSSSHRARKAVLKNAERDRAAFQFRQGLGRLMRTEGVLDRHLWVIDGRIWDPKRRWLFMPVKAMMRPYEARIREDVF